MSRSVIGSRSLQAGPVIIRGAARALSRIAESRRFSRLELERAARDLTTIINRIKAREYLHTSFRPRNTLAITDRTQEIYSDLKFFWIVGQVWAQIFRGLRLHRDSTVLDIGCGYFPKVELGLYYTAFQGKVTVLDLDLAALRRAASFLDFFAVPFAVKVACQSLWTMRRSAFDVVAANHVIDDLVIDNYCRRNRISIRKLYGNESLYIQAWRDIVRESEVAHELMRELAAKIDKLCTKGGWVILVDYPSFSHRALKLRRIINLTSKLQDTLRSALQDLGFVEKRPFPGGRLQVDRLTVTLGNCVCMKR